MLTEPETLGEFQLSTQKELPSGVPLIVKTEIDFSDATKISPVIQHALKSTIFSFSVSTNRISSQLDISHIMIRPDEQPETKIPYS